MTFIATLTDEADYVHVHRDNNSYRVATQIGYDDVTRHIFFLVVTLDVVPTLDYELRYSIERYDDVLEETTTYWDRSEVAKFIGKEDRKRILASLLSIIHHLLNDA